MKTTIGTSARDAEASRRTARKDGERDGQRNFPPRDPECQGAADYAGRTCRSEAATTDALTKASHFSRQRVEDDEQLGRARAESPHRTALTKDARQDYEDILADKRAYEQLLPLSAKFGFWPRSVVYALLLLLALGSGAAVTAALLAVTSDQTVLSYVIGGSVAIATVIGGAALGTLLRRRDLDHIKNGEYASSGRYTTGVLILGALGVLAIAFAVAGLRHSASEADAARAADAATVQVFIPGAQNPTQTPKVTPSRPKGVDWTIWLLLEIGLAAVSLSIEFQRSDIRAEHKERLDRDARTKHGTWTTNHADLAQAVAEHERTVLVRADHDLAVILTGSSQRSFADALTSEYRHGNLAERGHGGADPFEEAHEHQRLDADEALDGKPGADVLALAHGDDLDASAIVELIASNRDLALLHDAYLELGTAPGRPKRAPGEPWTPGADLGLDAAAQALRRANASTTDAGSASGDGADPNITNEPDAADVDITTLETESDDLLQPSTNGGPS